jgi:hypothetical protein
MNTEQPTIEISEILNNWHREILSGHAQKLYEAVWHQMRIKGATTIWLGDAEASRRSRMLIQHIPAARTELIDIGLLQCWQGNRQWSYEYIEQTDAQD